MRDGGTAVTADQSVGRARRQTKSQGDEIPGNCTEQSREQDLLRDHLDVNHALANGAGNRRAEDESGNEVPEGCPCDGAQRSEDPRGNDGGDGVRGIVPSVGELKEERKGDNNYEEREARH